jgi:hypothetical protein
MPQPPRPRSCFQKYTTLLYAVCRRLLGLWREWLRLHLRRMIAAWSRARWRRVRSQHFQVRATTRPQFGNMPLFHARTYSTKAYDCGRALQTPVPEAARTVAGNPRLDLGSQQRYEVSSLHLKLCRILDSRYPRDRIIQSAKSAIFTRGNERCGKHCKTPL